MSELKDPLDGKKIITGTHGKTTTLRCKTGETAIECAERHKAKGWDVPGGYKLGSDDVGPILEW